MEHALERFSLSADYWSLERSRQWVEEGFGCEGCFLGPLTGGSVRVLLALVERDDTEIDAPVIVVFLVKSN